MDVHDNTVTRYVMTVARWQLSCLQLLTKKTDIVTSKHPFETLRTCSCRGTRCSDSALPVKVYCDDMIGATLLFFHYCLRELRTDKMVPAVQQPQIPVLQLKTLQLRISEYGMMNSSKDSMSLKV